MYLFWVLLFLITQKFKRNLHIFVVENQKSFTEKSKYVNQFNTFKIDTSTHLER